MSIFSKKNTPETVELDTSNIIGKGTVINGDIDTLGNIRIDGNVIGYISSQAKIALGATSEIKGDIFAVNAEIAGQVVGNIFIKELLVLKNTADIKGDVFALKVIVEAGANIDGKVKVGEEPQQKAPDKAKRHHSEAHGKPKQAQQ
jgi:cytoskeletal protein CcmA (bactofilin family)